ncbi:MULTISPECIES: hypothetical protein [unclassified Thioalkalivibrio]|uniref:hypothetical protein n=1 Tax=unclassified Thioalkalivibrio TaxID=2621013 RepID=UPI00038297D7|nr:MULTISPECIES: hypothetical protein [unclassified Thioalkalivibrio]
MFPRWFLIAYLLFVCVLVPVYAVHYGWLNFLWLSNFALIAGCVAAWFESRRLASMLAVGVVLLEMGWVIDFLLGLVLLGNPPFDFVAYMFEPDYPLYLRLLSLYHLPLPFVLLWMVWRLGYDPLAGRLWIVVGWGVLVLSYLLSTPEANVNWALGPWARPQDVVHPLVWLGVLMAACALVWWVSHRVLWWGAKRFGRVVEDAR